MKPLKLWHYNHTRPLVKWLAFAWGWFIMRFMVRFFPRSYRKLLALMALFSAFMLGSALVGQYGFSLHPCDLCIYQRYPYAAIIVFGALGWFARSEKLAFSLVLLCALLFFVDSGIAFYHTGVEYGWFKGPDACSSGDTTGMTLEEMRAQIMHAPLVTCSQAMAYIFGLSMAAWNGVMAFAAGVASLLLMRKIA